MHWRHDRMLGEATPQAWALGDCEPGQEYRKTIEWEAKGVAPIPYRVPVGSYDHSALHQTLHAWAETYRDGVQGKEAIVVKHALTRPQESTQQTISSGGCFGSCRTNLAYRRNFSLILILPLH